MSKESSQNKYTTEPIVFITSNRQKLIELQRVIPEVQGIAMEVPELQTLDMEELVKAKARAAYALCNRPCIVDDTAFYLDCLRSQDGSYGLPGPLVKWFLQTITNKGLVDLAVRYNNMGAHARTMLGYALSADEVHIFDGIIHGSVAYPDKIVSDGWSAVFFPAGDEKPLGITMQEDIGVENMRAIAAHKLLTFLNNQ